MDIRDAKIIAAVTSIVEKIFAKREKQIINEVVNNLPLNEKGEKGDRGEQGPIGPRGEKGERGLDGNQGPRGFTGSQGPRGYKGEDGDMGPHGPKGDVGPAGSDGIDGKDGRDGNDGTPGERGPRGEKGDKGVPGNDGKNGAVGPQGIQGIRGPAGAKGDPGPDGKIGATGPRGPKGNPGEKGEPGKDGARGKDGRDGKDGAAPDISFVHERVEENLNAQKREIEQALNDVKRMKLRSGWGSTSSGGGSTNIRDNDDVVFKQLTDTTNGSILSFDTNLQKYVSNNVVRNAQYVSFDTTAAYQVGQGELAWNADEETLDLGQNGAILQIGQEIHYHVRNNTANTIPNGTAVMAVGTLGASGRITVAPSVANGTIRPNFYIGIATEDILPDTDGKVTHFGKIRGINTSSYNENDILWLDPNNSGGFTTTEPQAPNWKIAAAIVISSKNNGTIFVRYATQHNLEDLNNISVTNPANNDVLFYDGINGYWKHRPISEVSFSVRTISSNTTLISNDKTILVDASSANVYVTLPTIQAGNGKEFNIKKIDSSLNSIIVDGNSANIDGANTAIIEQQYVSLTLQNSNTQWWII